MLTNTLVDHLIQHSLVWMRKLRLREVILGYCPGSLIDFLGQLIKLHS